jgi:ferritin-like metal-binding protein YciE
VLLNRSALELHRDQVVAASVTAMMILMTAKPPDWESSRLPAMARLGLNDRDGCLRRWNGDGLVHLNRSRGAALDFAAYALRRSVYSGSRGTFRAKAALHKQRPPNSMETTMAKAAKKLDDLFHDTLKDIYFAEKKILSALPKMAKAAQDEKLQAAFEKHHGETETHVSRLEQVFEAIDAKPQGKTCDAIMGIIEEGQEIMADYKGSPALDAGLLAAAQAVEHYEISRYGTLRTWAKELGLSDAAELLAATLEEEKATDETLTQIAETVVNQEAQSRAA